MVNNSLKSLREKVAKARQDEKNRLEKKRLKKELFDLENPGLKTLKKGTISSAKAFGRGALVTARGIQKFAVERERVGRLREEGRKKIRPAIRKATRQKQKAFRKFRKKAKSPRRETFDEGGFDFDPLGGF